jgi:predicted ester cyclase
MPAQPVDATQALNLSAGVSNCKVSRGRSSDWMKGLMTIMPDGSYEVKSFATDTERNNVAAYGVFSGTHTGPGGPCEPTGKKTISDYVYVMQFTGDKISHMTKIWHSGMALEELGWA